MPGAWYCRSGTSSCPGKSELILPRRGGVIKMSFLGRVKSMVRKSA